MSDVPPLDRNSLVHALREDQAGRSSFPPFLASAWRASVVRYDVDFVRRRVPYHGTRGEESAAVTLP